MRERIRVEDATNIKDKRKEPIKYNGGENEKLGKKIGGLKMSWCRKEMGMNS